MTKHLYRDTLVHGMWRGYVSYLANESFDMENEKPLKVSRQCMEKLLLYQI